MRRPPHNSLSDQERRLNLFAGEIDWMVDVIHTKVCSDPIGVDKRAVALESMIDYHVCVWYAGSMGNISYHLRILYLFVVWPLVVASPADFLTQLESLFLGLVFHFGDAYHCKVPGFSA